MRQRKPNKRKREQMKRRKAEDNSKPKAPRRNHLPPMVDGIGFLAAMGAMVSRTMKDRD